jgi:hypothetical protein
MGSLRPRHQDRRHARAHEGDGARGGPARPLHAQRRTDRDPSCMGRPHWLPVRADDPGGGSRGEPGSGRGVGGAVAALPRCPPPPPHGPAALPGGGSQGRGRRRRHEHRRPGRPRRRHGHQHRTRGRRHHPAHGNHRLHRPAHPDRADRLGPGAHHRPVPGPARPVVSRSQAAGRPELGAARERPQRRGGADHPVHRGQGPARPRRPCLGPSRRWATPALPCSARSGSPDAASR